MVFSRDHDTTMFSLGPRLSTGKFYFPADGQTLDEFQSTMPRTEVSAS